MFTRGGQALDDMTRGKRWRGLGEASGKRITQQEGGGGRQRNASGRRTTQQESCHCGGRRWWNPPVGVSANVDAVARQSQSRKKKEGRGPIVLKAGEQSTTTTRMQRARMMATMMLSSLQRLRWGRKTKSAVATAVVTAAVAVGCSLWSVGGYRRKRIK
jgi:hypothetical protein